MSRMSSRSTLALLRTQGFQENTDVASAALAEVERQRQLIHTELKERLGIVYKTLKMDSIPATYYYVFLLAKALAVGLMVGWQQGAGIAVGSRAALGLNCGAFGACILLAALVLVWQPHSSGWQNLMQLVVLALECGVLFCVLILSWYTGIVGWQDAAFALQVATFCLAVIFGMVATCALGQEVVSKIRKDRHREAKLAALTKEEAEIWAAKWQRAQTELKHDKDHLGNLADAAKRGEQDGLELRKQLLAQLAGAAPTAPLSTMPTQELTAVPGTQPADDDEGRYYNSTVGGTSGGSYIAPTKLPAQVEGDMSSESDDEDRDAARRKVSTWEARPGDEDGTGPSKEELDRAAADLLHIDRTLSTTSRKPSMTARSRGPSRHHSFTSQAAAPRGRKAVIRSASRAALAAGDD
uniref:Transmembrane protein n=1 Tax=Chlamydomonas leiostraca TaxID=1034604 RepID=A0A7S0R9Y4_9CHLO